MVTTKSRASQFAEWTERPAQDFDPEVEVPDEDSSGGSEASADEDAGTEHYVDVGKSKLRRREPVALGPQYRGAPVRRSVLEEEDDDGDSDSDEEESEGEGEDASFGRKTGEFDDPDEIDLEADQEDASDAEIDSNDAFNESDEERFKDFVFRGSSQALPKRGKRATQPTAADFMMSDEDNDNDDGAEVDGEGTSDEDVDDEEEASDDAGIGGFINDSAEEDEDEGSEEEDDDEGDDDEDDIDEDQGEKDSGNDLEIARKNRAAIREMMNASQQGVASTLSSIAQKDVAKGKAVRQQQKAFDALLNIRIRLQKSLVAVNSLGSIEDSGEDPAPYEAAEAAALKLWNAIDGYRLDLQSDSTDKTGQKRKRAAEADTPIQDMWENMQAIEQRAVVRRRVVLEKWSHSAKNIRMTDKSSSRFTSTVEKSLTTRLDEELDAPERLIKRTRIPRSCAPAQVAQKINEDPDIYDDADFYQLLLKDLVDQRTGDASGGLGSSAATIRFAAAKEAKAKRHVDTKASKGRKMRFNVHGKLQNFMASEDRRSWEQTAIDRFFGTLFGQKMVLSEDQDEHEAAASDEDMGGAPVEGDGIRLFRD
ncbi:TRAUB-domain-containing protein [Durotheca rogersii]|uniref:TRAUB-domain-containing protein n=1 Tax=Durotheca rogersii TaxID=419775 RepID=UPI00221EDCC9|nr:TRAUB-domain-containing protein [Durotheca rogersii]KAI5866300.1 TRAUB-domain-containing protein [Durotheca rogersii]